MPSSIEKIESNTPESKKTSPQVENDEGVSELTESISDAIDLEGIETLTMGNVSEKAAKSKDLKNTQMNGATNNTSSANVAVKNLPSPSKMRVDVEKKIRQEIQVLSKKAIKLAKQSHKKGNFFELTIVMRKLRKLKFLLNNLLKFSVEQVKNLWFRFVKGGEKRI